MKKMSKIFLAILFAEIISLRTVYAATGQAVYNGRQITVTGMANEQNLLPGQTVTVDMEIVNQSSNTTNWYISNEVLSSFEDSSSEKASGGGYTYVLSYNGTDLYNSNKVGGTEEGLKQLNYETDRKYFYLGTLAANGKGNLTMKVGLDGESQANAYELASAALQLAFAVEEEEPARQQTSNPEKKTVRVRIYVPNTGAEQIGILERQHTFYYLIVCLCILVMSVSGGYLVYSHRKENR